MFLMARTTPAIRTYSPNFATIRVDMGLESDGISDLDLLLGGFAVGAFGV
jgi:hypothetical protein